ETTEATQSRADRTETARCRRDAQRGQGSSGRAPGFGSEPIDLRSLAQPGRRHEGRGGQAPRGTGGREPPTEAPGGRSRARQPDAQAHRGGKLVSPSRKRAAVCELRAKFAVSERRACKTLNQPRMSQRYKPKPRDDEPKLAARMCELARSRPRFGYRRIGKLLRDEAWSASDTRVYRLWRREGLKVPQKKRKRRRLGKSANGCQRRRALHKDHVWCWDF